MKPSRITAHRKIRWLTLGLTLVMLLSAIGVAQAADEDWVNLPRTATGNGLRIEILSPAHDGTNAGENITFRLKVTDMAGKPVENAQLNFTAVRDYSGQVKKEFNGPHDPNLGPYPLQPTGTPGEYTVTANFWHNGHWQLIVNGPSLGTETLHYTQSIAADPADGTGFSWDWLIWPGMFLVVVGVVWFTGQKGDKFPVPAEEVKGYSDTAPARGN